MTAKHIEPVVHMIGNAHIDPVWLWRIGEGREEVLSTYRSALDRMEETPGFVFSSGSAATYRWVQEDAPDLFAAIQQRVAEGRWSLVGGWWVQPDCNLPSGESFVRHGLYGQRALMEMFGMRAVTGYNVDSFGHACGLPQILLGCGLRNYVFFRPESGREMDLPGTLFWWESDDGSRVLASRPPLHYSSRPGGLTERIVAAASKAPVDLGHVMCFYGVGNHGGGPTKENIASITRAIARPDGPQVCFDSTDRFFEAVRARATELPVVHSDLQHHARGCYTAISSLKWYNRKCEHALLTAEKLAALSHHFLGSRYPLEALTLAWQSVLFNQFHDILAGTSIREACEDANAAYAESLEIAQIARDTALSAISAQIDTQGAGRSLLVFNPLAWAQSVPVETAVMVTEHWNEDWEGSFRPGVVCLTDDRGQEVPCQVTALEHSGAYYVLHLCFLAELPALGYRCYHLAFPDDAPTWSPPEPQKVLSIENAHLRLSFDPESGWLTSLIDKANGLETLRDAACVPLVIDDPSDTWSHDVISFDREVGRFHAQGDVSLVEDGPVRQVVRVRSQWGCSTVESDYVLYASARQVTLDLTVDWHEQGKMLKLAIPLALRDPQSTSSAPYGSIQRTDDGGEEPCQGWVDVRGMIDGRPCGFTLLNDSKYGYDVLAGELRMSILRSPVYAFHRPRRIEPGVTYHYTDQGEQVVRLALVPYSGSWQQEGDVVRCAESLNAPPVAYEVEAHPGEWPACASLVRCSPSNVVLTTIKLAEDGEDLILRGYETSGHETEAEIHLGLGAACSRWTVTWKPHEIKTLRLRDDPPTLIEVNMLEEERAH